MQYWFWWRIRYDFKEDLSLKIPKKGGKIALTRVGSLVSVDMPIGGGNIKGHIIKGLYTIKDFIEKPEKKVSVLYEEERYKKNNQIKLRSFFSEKQISFYFQMMYRKVFILYNLRKLKLNILAGEKGLVIFTYKDMIGVTKSYDIFKWSYQIKINIQLTQDLLKDLQGNVFNSFFSIYK